MLELTVSSPVKALALAGLNAIVKPHSWFGPSVAGQLCDCRLKPPPLTASEMPVMSSVADWFEYFPLVVFTPPALIEPKSKPVACPSISSTDEPELLPVPTPPPEADVPSEIRVSPRSTLSAPDCGLKLPLRFPTWPKKLSPQ